MRTVWVTGASSGLGLAVAQAFAALTDASTGPDVIDTGVSVLRAQK